MAPVECALVDSLMRPVTQAPVLSVIIPTYQRPTEMALAVRSIALQIDPELDGKVEIIVTDNASGDGETATRRGMACKTAASASHCGSKFPLLARPRTMSASFRRAASIAFGRPLTVGASRPQASSKAFPSAFS